MARHAPAGGYDFEAKHLGYRKKLWRWVDDQFANRVPKTRRVVAYLDTREALETQHLLSLGYSAKNLHAINFNPAEVALLTMRLDSLGLPRVRTHGKDFVRSLAEANVPKWHVMAFDGCGPVASPNTLRCIRRMSEMATPGTVVVANVLAGRDTGAIAYALRAEREAGRSTHNQRWAWLERAFTVRSAGASHVRQLWSVAAKRRGIYTSSSGQPMLWLAVRLAPPKPLGFEHEILLPLRELRAASLPLSAMAHPTRRAALATANEAMGSMQDTMAKLVKSIKDAEVLRSGRFIEVDGA